MGRKRKVEEVEAPTKKDSEPEEDTSSLKKPLKQTKKKKKDRDVEGESPPEASSSPPPLKKSKSPKKGPSPVKSPKKDLKGSKSPGTIVPVLEASDAEEDSDEAEDIIAPQVDEEFDPENLPSVDTLHKLLERIETHLPKEDRVKYDSQVRKLDWEKIAFEGLSASHCQSTWMYIQARIRRFRVLSEMIPDAREWIQHPWTNFYKSRTFNRHPDMPKKPLSVYMFYYSQHMNKILKKNPDLSMPEVAKICSEQYAQLSEEKKLKYKEKCDEMKAEYNLKMNEFYSVHPDMAPVVKASKKGGAKQEAMKPVEPFVPPPTLQLQQQQPQTTYVLAAPNVLTLPTVPHPQVTAAVTAPPTMALPQMAASNNNNNIVYDPKYLPKPAKNAFSGAPERPVKPFELFFKKEMESVSGDPAFDRQAFAQKSRKEWKEMKNKKKAKWIKAAFENYRKYEAELREFTAANPTYVPPMSSHKNFLTIEDQKILDRSMGRPEKPSSSAYSLFSKEMLNNEDIKKYPSKERMSHISELWKTLPDEKKER
ncbi:Uncharacterized protein FKW44_010999 [Caligus rogercresseyi]|uniref:HMG box domain-containing protein n=1 Tax=Caligus rogercresseyi TaxID=217165 RepID=A0A7T8HHP4_CALRO|nr:Uncharacterized protein FKW44_010999 [Caligus rogercresseyi]